MLNRLTVVLCGMILTTLPSTSALADTVYTYTGNTFTVGDHSSTPEAPFTTSDSVSGWFTVSAPLPANRLIAHISPSTFSFSNGITTFTNADLLSGNIFQIGTDGSGAINQWFIEFQTNNGLGSANSVHTENDHFFVDDYGILIGASLVKGGAHPNDPGTWTQTSTGDPSPVPEPSSLMLLGTGAIGVACSLRRRLSRVAL